MAIPNASNANKIKNSTHACPNLGINAHSSSRNATVGHLTQTQMRAAIGTIDTSSSSRLMWVARRHAATAGIDSEDLLQEAILRALTTRKCPAGLKVKNFLMGVMRSIASEIIAKRERYEALYHGEFDLLTSPPTPDQAFEMAELAAIWKQVLQHVIGGSPEIEKVVDGIDQGLSGTALIEFANTNRSKLASMRRTIKRRTSRALKELKSQ